MEIIGFMLLSLLIISFTVVVGFLSMVFKEYTQDYKPKQKKGSRKRKK